jgi:hypothetical protein
MTKPQGLIAFESKSISGSIRFIAKSSICVVAIQF